MDCRAKVVRKEGKRALVRVARVNCAECGGCGLLARNREHTMEFNALDRLGAREGDEVILSVPSRRLVVSYLVVFGMPVLAMAAAYFIVAALYSAAGGGGGQGAGVIAAAITGLVSFWLGVRLAERIGLSPVITDIVVAGEECRDSDGDDGEGFDGKVL
jgi:positive regulator of sigma E activity